MKRAYSTILRSFVVCGIAYLLMTCAVEKPLKIYRMTGAAQGTYYAITYSSDSNEDLQPQVDSLFKQFDRSVSSYLPSSVISRINNNDTTARTDAIYTLLFQKSMEVSANSGGAFDVTVGPLVNGWGFGFAHKAQMTQAVVDSLLPLVGYKKVRLENGKLLKADPRMRIDFDAIAQGYCSDWLGRFLESKGINNYLIDVGGEVLGKGTKPDGRPWSVGIETPAQNATDERKVQAILTLRDMAISTSGSYRKYFEENGVRYSHTIDPANGYPVKHNLLSVSVLAPDCITADAYATAFMVMGVEKSRAFLLNHPELNAYFISDDQKGGYLFYHTPGFDEYLTQP
ncbi:MAG: FAD:protein FMN transferase [Marinilabiliales bacterium]|nr:FAD:protein FMN transferase [Marinilabiliales bacterium]